MDRDNATWLAELGAENSERASALADLREALLRGLRRALSGRSRVDDAFLEDAVQDALVRILDRLDQFAGRSRFVTWATSIAIHVAMSDLRRRRWTDVSLESVENMTTDPRETRIQTSEARSTPETEWERKEIYETLHRLIESDLTEKQRMALLAELRGMPQEVIARQLGSNRNAVYKLTHDARKRLKQGLEAAGFSVDDLRSASVR